MQNMPTHAHKPDLEHMSLQEIGDQLAAALEKEALLMAGLRHPNTVFFLGACLDPPCMVTEHCARGSLFDVLQSARGVQVMDASYVPPQPPPMSPNPLPRLPRKPTQPSPTPSFSSARALTRHAWSPSTALGGPSLMCCNPHRACLEGRPSVFRPVHTRSNLLGRHSQPRSASPVAPTFSCTECVACTACTAASVEESLGIETVMDP